MTVELWMLVGSALLAVVLIVPQAGAMALQWGPSPMAGNRADVTPLKGWGGRAQRAHRNLLENLVLFAVVVLAAQAAGVANAMTVFGAELFLACRVAHAVVYIAGIPYARTLAWAGGIVGIVIIVVQLV